MPDNGRRARRARGISGARWASLALALAAVAGSWAFPARAEESHAERSRHDLFFGTDLSVTSRFVYSGAIIAPTGSLDEQGLRVRAYGGAGRYRLADGTWVDKQAGHALIGWTFWNADRGATLYAGVGAEHHDAAPTQSKHGTKVGVSLLAEGWLRVDAQTLASASAEYSSVYDTLAGRIALTRQLTPRWGLIGEVRGGNDVDGTFWAAGAGVTAHVRDIDAALIAGASGDEDDTGFSLRAEIRTRR